MERKKYNSQKLTCVVCGPETNQENYTLFNFPKCPEQKAKWLEALNVSSIKKRSRVCQLHFERDQLIRVLLKPGALPSLSANNKHKTNADLPLQTANLSNILPKPKEPLQEAFQPNAAYIENSSDLSENVHSSLSLSCNPVLRAAEDTNKRSLVNPFIITTGLPFAAATIPLYHDSLNAQLNRDALHFSGKPSNSKENPAPLALKPDQIHPAMQLLSPPIILNLCASVLNPTKKAELNHTICRRKINKLTERLKTARNRKGKKFDIRALIPDNSKLCDFIEWQIKRQNNKKAYSTTEKTMALSIFYACGNNGYKLLRSLGIALPATRTIRAWMENFNFLPGINEELFDAIREATLDFNAPDKDCVLCWDEMAIKELIEFNRSTDAFEGVTDLGSLGRSLQPANEVLVFMIQGISRKWKIPISYYFSNSATKAEHLEKLVTENVAKVAELGLKVRIMICDMAFTNRSLYKHLGVTPNSPTCYIETHKIYCIHDTPHLVKLVRNNLCKHDFYLRNCIGKKVISNRIRWLHIVNFFNKDRRLSVRMAPKLTVGDIYLKDFSKMKVKLATQVFSHSVYAGMSAMIRLCILKKDATPTANFVKCVDDMFDLVNISKYSDDRPNRCARNLFSCMHRFDNHLKLLNSLQIPSFPHEPEFVEGLKLSLLGIKMLCEDLMLEGYTHVYTRQLQQDCLENFFAGIRMKGGFCRNPTARQFRTNFKYLFMAKLLKNPDSSNTEGTNTSFTNVIEKIKGKPKGQITCTNTIESPLNASQFYGRKIKRKLKLGVEQEKSVISYFGPACILAINRKNRCKTCANMLCYKNNKKHDLVDFKQFDLSRRLASLNRQTALVFLRVNSLFDKFAQETLNAAGHSIVSSILKLYLSDKPVSEWLGENCQAHKLQILNYFIRAKLYRSVKDKNETLRKLKSWNQTRRDLRNQ